MGTLSQHLLRLSVVLALCLGRLRARRGDRGDVPGWVLVAVMTAGLVGVLGAVASEELGGLLRRALRSVE